jgi:hypothetical protein
MLVVFVVCDRFAIRFQFIISRLGSSMVGKVAFRALLATLIETKPGTWASEYVKHQELGT